jgi:branched-chain amino acid transport system ATP-binding protein
MIMLECRNLSVFYGQHHALDKISIHIHPGEIVVILGANGAGKSSLLKAIAGMIPTVDGSEVNMDGADISDLPAHLIVETGLALVPEGRGIFGDLTVLENLKLGAFPERADAAEKVNLERVLSLFPKLNERKNQIARTMSGGEQQMVAIGRALMSAPSILMLDEPSLGLSPILCSELFKTLEEVRGTGVGILLVEQNAKQSLAISNRGYLLEVGRITGEDKADRLMNDPAVQKAYLGGPAASTPAGAVTTSGSQHLASAELGIKTFVIKPNPNKAAQLRTNQIIPDDINALVSRAVEVQTDQMTKSATQTKTMASGPAPETSGDLRRVLSEIEQAAANARMSARASTQLRANGAAPNEENKVRPKIEIYRKPRIEVYRRNKSGSGDQMIKIKG